MLGFPFFGVTAHASRSIAICAVYERTTGKYGERGIRYAHIETGHVAQNLCLMATELELRACVVGAFRNA